MPSVEMLAKHLSDGIDRFIVNRVSAGDHASPPALRLESSPDLLDGVDGHHIVIGAMQKQNRRVAPRGGPLGVRVSTA